MLPNEGQHPPGGPDTGHRGSVQSVYPATLGPEPGSGSIAGNLINATAADAGVPAALASSPSRGSKTWPGAPSGRSPPEGEKCSFTV